MARQMISDDLWQRIELLLPLNGTKGRPRNDDRGMLEAILRVQRTGSPWRDLPPELGPWPSAYARLARWQRAGVWDRVWAHLKKNADHEWCSLDSSYVRVHQHGTGSRKGPDVEGIGISRGGRTSKVHIRVDALGLPIGMRVTPGQEADIHQASALIEEIRADYEIADRGYGSDALRARIIATGATPVIPGRINRLVPVVIDTELYKERNAVERYFCRMKQWRRLATRYDKTLVMFTAALTLAHIWSWLQ